MPRSEPRPLIGVTRSDGRGRAMTQFNRWAVRRAGGRTVVLSPGRPAPLNDLDGLVVGGGADIEAVWTPGGVRRSLELDPERDRLERDLLAAAERVDLPVLGICRGAQMINARRGGTLHQDIYDVYGDAPRVRTVLPKKRIDIDANSRLAAIIGAKPAVVNALHHQSIDRLGRALAIAARDSVGIVQAIEDPQAHYCIGVQWHPEFLLTRRRQQRLFDELVAAARARPHSTEVTHAH